MDKYKRGRNGEEPAALLRVGTGEQSEGAFFKLWESERKINQPEHTAGDSQNKGTEKLQRRAGHPRWRQEAGGGERGKVSPKAADLLTKKE